MKEKKYKIIARNDNNSAVKVNDITKHYINQASLDSDPFGSWTGKPKDPGEAPVQDVDDL